MLICINKYYILDLSPHNSLVSFLVENNFQVFLISWVNPDISLSAKGFEDYLKDGILVPFEYVIEILVLRKLILSDIAWEVHSLL
ncbi:MAG: hypothetical protein AB8U53_04635 [Rickettsia aeschlimannii]